VEGMLARLAPLADVAYAAKNQSDRTRDAATIAAHLGAQGKPVQVFENVAEAVEAALAAAGSGDCILVTGSLYTVADARRALGRPSGDL
jgi:folylpolyglutamate synthase/dihydropteroate synthase